MSSVVKSSDTRKKMLSLSEAVAWVEHQRHDGIKIVFTNGVFDILHPGHIRYLQEARREGDALIVGVNSDRSVRAIKIGRARCPQRAAR